MAGWTYTAVNLDGEEYGKDHYGANAVASCASKMAARLGWQGPVFILIRSSGDREAGRTLSGR